MEETGLLDISYQIDMITDEIFYAIVDAQPTLREQFLKNKKEYKLNKNRDEKRRVKERKQRMHLILTDEL
jgi:hypothetical protein